MEDRTVSVKIYESSNHKLFDIKREKKFKSIAEVIKSLLKGQ